MFKSGGGDPCIGAFKGTALATRLGRDHRPEATERTIHRDRLFGQEGQQMGDRPIGWFNSGCPRAAMADPSPSTEQRASSKEPHRGC